MSSIYLNPDWQGKLPTELNEEQIKTINLFERDEIFEHNYDAEFLFNQFYKSITSKPKRHPNSFMLMRTVFGLVARKKQISKELKDGTNQSVLAGLIWKIAAPEEKKRFHELADKFKDLHKKRFPKYEYKPKPKPTSGNIFNTKTPNDFMENAYNYFAEQPISSFTFPFDPLWGPLWGPSLFTGYQDQIAQHQPTEQSTFVQSLSLSQQTLQHQPLHDVFLTDVNNSQLNQSFMINGDSSQDQQQLESALNKLGNFGNFGNFQQEPQHQQSSTIAANCLSYSEGQDLRFYDPSSY